MGRFLVILALISSTAWSQDKPEEILNAVVGVNAKIRPNARSAESLGTERRGTGVLIRDGYVLTIGYLVIEAEAIQVTGADGRTVPATLAGYDHVSGFGLLKLVGPSRGKPLPLGDSKARAACARIALELGLAGTHELADELEARSRVRRNVG